MRGTTIGRGWIAAAVLTCGLLFSSAAEGEMKAASGGVS